MSNTEILEQVSELLSQWDSNSFTSGLIICAADYKSRSRFCQVVGNDYFCGAMLTSFMQVGPTFSQLLINATESFLAINQQNSQFINHG